MTPPAPPSLPYRNGQLQYHVRGAPWRPFSDLYFHLMRAPTWQLVALSLLAYVAVIGLFAGLFWVGDHSIRGARPGSFADCFWFSVQTFSTIGYGTMSPQTPWSNVLVTLESWLGLSGVAVVTALLFSKFARPTARIRFSKALVVCQRNGQRTLQLRIANERTSGLVDVELEVWAIVSEESPEGQRLTRLRHVALQRSRLPYLGMTFTGIHAIGEDSPLAGFRDADEPGEVRAIRVNLRGVDLSMLQPVWAMEMYPAEAIRFGERFVDMVERVDGVPTLTLTGIDQTESEPGR